MHLQAMLKHMIHEASKKDFGFEPLGAAEEHEPSTTAGATYAVEKQRIFHMKSLLSDGELLLSDCLMMRAVGEQLHHGAIYVITWPSAVPQNQPWPPLKIWY